MKIIYQEVTLQNHKSLLDYNIFNDSSLIVTKKSLSELPGIKVSYEPDMITLDDQKE